MTNLNSLPPHPDQKQPHQEEPHGRPAKSDWFDRKTLWIVIILILYGAFELFSHQANVPQNNKNPNHPLEPLDLSSLPGFFIQDDRDQDPQDFHIYHPNSSFGLIDHRFPDRWIRFQQKIKHLIEHRSVYHSCKNNQNRI
jgi:hypothetical protein